MAGGAGLHTLKKRIKSIKSTRQVTKAMEAVSASKMRKAVAKAVASRDYATLGTEVVQRLSASSQDHTLFIEREVKTCLLIVYTSDRGLCGAMNTQLMKKALAYIREKKATGIHFRIITIGKKAQNSMRRAGLEIEQTYTALGDKPTSVILRPIATTAMQAFRAGEVDKVVLAYTDFKSSLRQEPVLRRVLPFSAKVFEATGADDGTQTQVTVEDRNWREYLFEPGKETILNTLIPRLVEVQVYQALLESVASEHSSRMLAMRNATDAASEMIGDLSLTYNQARQAGITQEIAEISAGRLALE